MIAQSRAIPIILTRPAEQGARFAQELLARFDGAINVIQSPLLSPQYLQPEIGPGPWNALIFTSATAVTASGLLGPIRARLPRKAYCVGDRTAEVARSLGFEAISAKGSAASLCATIRDAGEPGPLLHLRGEETAGDISAELNLAGIETYEAVLYREIAQALTAEARITLRGELPVILPVFSPRSGKILAQELAALPHSAALLTVAISPAVAVTLDPITVMRRFVADRPDAESMLIAVGQALTAAQAA